jgi:hypothetical protein
MTPDVGVDKNSRGFSRVVAIMGLGRRRQEKGNRVLDNVYIVEY